MVETLAVDAVQEWLDESNVSCGSCGSESLTVEDTSYESMLEGRFGDVTPHHAELTCDECGTETVNSLVESVVNQVRARES